jgi:hypothetical protein
MLRLLFPGALTVAALLAGLPVSAQNFGSPVDRKQITLVRKLPPAGHLSGSSFAVRVAGANVPPDIAINLKSTLEALLVKDEPRLRSVEEKEHPDALILCQITGYDQPPAQTVQESTVAFNKKGGPLQNQPMTRVRAEMKIAFQAQDTRAGKSIAADTIATRFDREFAVQTAQQQNSSTAKLTHILGGHIPTVPGIGSHATSQADADDKPPTPLELHQRMVDDAAQQIASLLVNTSEEVSVLLARGGGLDDADTLIQQKLYTRALESLETMTPFSAADADAYRIYNLGVVNEALAYQADDVNRARKYLGEASIDYGKALDAKQNERQFLGPQTRIDTALAHYKVLSEEKTPIVTVATAAAATPAEDALTNSDVIGMVQAKLDQANILDTIQHSSSVRFDVSAKGQIDLAKAGVNGAIIAAMKQKARGQ